MPNITVTLSALTMDGLPAIDPHVTIQIREVAPFQRALNGVTINDFDGDAQFGLALPDGGESDLERGAELLAVCAGGRKLLFPRCRA